MFVMFLLLCSFVMAVLKVFILLCCDVGGIYPVSFNLDCGVGGVHILCFFGVVVFKVFILWGSVGSVHWGDVHYAQLTVFGSAHFVCCSVHHMMFIWDCGVGSIHFVMFI